MQVTFIACPFKTSYGPATESLKKAIERKTATKVEWVASNCGCGDDVEINRQFQMPGCKYFEMITITDHPTRSRLKLWLKLRAREFFYYFRARKYRRLSAGAEVVHFQQTLNAYGSTVLFHWLRQSSQAARVVTIHELDRHQLTSPKSNQAYNEAGAIIVQQGAMRDQLVGLGVDPDKIEIVLHGADLAATDEKQAPEGIMFFCGHHPWEGKGLLGMFQAVAMLKTRLGAAAPRLKVHAYLSGEDLVSLKNLAAQLGLTNDITWLNQSPMADVVRAVQLVAYVCAPIHGQFRGACRGQCRRRRVAGDRHKARRHRRTPRRKPRVARKRQPRGDCRADRAVAERRRPPPRPFPAATRAGKRTLELGRGGRRNARGL